MVGVAAAEVRSPSNETLRFEINGGRDRLLTLVRYPAVGKAALGILRPGAQKAAASIDLTRSGLLELARACEELADAITADAEHWRSQLAS